MRIISGSLGGRSIRPPAKMPYTRPTTDIAREGLFNILQNNFDLIGLKTLDLFGGTGTISYELYSRGASDLTIVEKDRTMYDFIVRTAETLKCENFKVIRSDVFKFIDQSTEQCDFIFAGPPYTLATIDELPVKIFRQHLLKEKGWFVLEHTTGNDFKDDPHFARSRNYGSTVFSIFVNKTEL